MDHNNSRSFRVASAAAGFFLVITLQLKAATYEVDVASSFSPQTLNIHAGDTVLWASLDDVDSHTTTSNTGLWRGLLVNSGDTFSRTFATTGTFGYHDEIDGLTGSIVVTAAVNSPPSVAITSPANGTILNAPASFILAADASDSDGTVASVQFYRGSNSLGSSTISPYSVAVTNLAAGTYTLSAVAADNQGAKATNSISLTVTAAAINLSGSAVLAGTFQLTRPVWSLGKQTGCKSPPT